MKSGWSLLILLILLLVGSSCGSGSEAGEENQWQFEEVDDPFQSLAIPGTTRFSYIGVLGEKHYFFIGPAADERALIGRFSPQGWSIDEELSLLLSAPLDEQLQGAAPRLFNIPSENAHLLLSTAPFQIFRSDDSGQSWEKLEVPGLSEGIEVLSRPRRGDVEGGLYLRGRNGETGVPDVVVTHDGGRSWNSLGDQGSPYQVYSGVRLSGTSISIGAEEGFQTLPEECQSDDSLFQWTEFGGAYYRPHQQGWIRLTLPDQCEVQEVSGLGAFPDLPGTEDQISRLEVLGEELFAITTAGRLGRLVDEKQVFEEIMLPGGERMVAEERGRATLYELPQGEMALQTPRGIWRQDSSGTWDLTAPAPSSIPFLSEVDGILITSLEGRYFRRPPGAPGWEEFTFQLDGERHRGQTLELLQREEGYLAIGRSHPILATSISLPWSLSLAFREELDFLPRRTPIHGPTALRFVEAGTDRFLLSRGSMPFVLLPGSEELDGVEQQEVSGGGIYRVNSYFPFDIDVLEVDLPRGPGGKEATIHSGAIFEEHLYVVTGLFGVHRAPLGTAQGGQRLTFEPFHQGLPEASFAGKGEEILEVKVVDDRLFAFGADSLFELQNETWVLLTSGHLGSSFPLRPLGIVDFLFLDGEYLLIAYDGVYVLDQENGNTRRVWTHEGRIIEMAAQLPSGLYLGLRNGGLFTEVRGQRSGTEVRGQRSEVGLFRR